MTVKHNTNIIPSSLFRLQRWEPHDECSTSIIGQKRDASFFLTLPEFSMNSTNDNPTDTVRKALSVLSKSQIPFLPNELSHKDGKVISQNSTSDTFSVSTVSTSSLRDEESDIEIDEDNLASNISLPPDALFIVQGVEFPCHTTVLSKEAPPLLDILSTDGVLERKIKRQRTSSPSQDQPEGDKEPQSWSSPSGITVARLPNDVDSGFFEVFMEFLYTKEIRLKLEEGYQIDDDEDDPWLNDKEDVFETLEEDEDVVDLPDVLSSSFDEDTKASSTPLKFLQGSFSLADRFGCISLKNAIENKIYDEFLFSFTAKELFTWADQNNCTYLKQKAMDKLSATRDGIDIEQSFPRREINDA